MQQGTVKKDAQGLPGGSRVLKSSNSSDWRNLSGELLWLVLSLCTCGWISSLLSAQNGVMLRLLPSLNAAGAVISLLLPAGAPAAFWLPFFSFLIEVSCCLLPMAHPEQIQVCYSIHFQIPLMGFPGGLVKNLMQCRSPRRQEPPEMWG